MVTIGSPFVLGEWRETSMHTQSGAANDPEAAVIDSLFCDTRLFLNDEDDSSSFLSIHSIKFITQMQASSIMFRSILLRATTTKTMQAAARTPLVPLIAKRHGSTNESSLFYGSLVVATTLATTMNLLHDNKKTSECSGIIGVVGGPTCDAR